MKNKLILLPFASSSVLLVTGCFVEHFRGYARGPVVAASYSHGYNPVTKVVLQTVIMCRESVNVLRAGGQI